MVDPDKIRPHNEGDYPYVFVPDRFLRWDARWTRHRRQAEEMRARSSDSCSVRGCLLVVLVPVLLVLAAALHQLLAGSLTVALVLLAAGRLVPQVGRDTLFPAWGAALAVMLLPAVGYLLVVLGAEVLVNAGGPGRLLTDTAGQFLDHLAIRSRMVTAAGGWELTALPAPFDLAAGAVTLLCFAPGTLTAAWWLRRGANGRRRAGPLGWLATLVFTGALTVLGWFVTDIVGGAVARMAMG